MDHEGMSHAGRGGGVEKDKQEILSLFVWKSRERVPVEVLCKEFELKSPVKRIPF